MRRSGKAGKRTKSGRAKRRHPRPKQTGTRRDRWADEDVVRCRLCNKWYRNITWTHLRAAHGITTVEEYKERFGLTYVVAEDLRREHSELRTKWTPDRVIDAIRNRDRQGKSIRLVDVHADYSGLVSAAVKHFDSWANAVGEAGIDYEKTRVMRKPIRWTRDRVIEEIEKRRQRGEALNAASVNRDHCSLYRAASTHLGGWQQALVAAGVDPEQVKFRREKYTSEEILTELRRLHRSGKLRLATQMKTSREYHSLYTACTTHFESFRQAVKAAGIDYEEFRRKKMVRLLRWNREKVLREIRRHYARRSRGAVPTALYKAAHRFFGDWAEAVAAAGLDWETLKHPPRYWSKKKVVARIRRRKRNGRPLNTGAVQKEDKALAMAARTYFGGWRDAIEAAGFDYERVRCDGRRFTDEQILAALRRLHRAGKLRLASEMKASSEHGRLYNACTNYFGSFRNAVEAAGIDYEAHRRKTLSRRA